MLSRWDRDVPRFEGIEACFLGLGKHAVSHVLMQGSGFHTLRGQLRPLTAKTGVRVP